LTEQLSPGGETFISQVTGNLNINGFDAPLTFDLEVMTETY